jgi:hypothetical protein
VTPRTALAAVAATLALALPAPGAAQRAPLAAEWRQARWGMSVDEVLKAFPGEARRLETPVALADGNVVAAGIDRHELAGVVFRVRFVFHPSGGLVLVSLRTDEKDRATPERFGAVEKALAGRLGPPTERGQDDSFVEMRQATWKGERGRIDVKYIPGTLVVLHAAPSQVPPRAEPAPVVPAPGT